MNQEVELRHLRYFVAVAEELHFGKAAARLQMAQPPLSQQIKKLEELLGVKLFIRTSRAVALTPAGATLLERSLRMLVRVRDDVEAVKRVGRGETGVLRVGFVGSAMLTRLPKILHVYRRLFPDVQLQLQELYSAAIVNGLNEHTIDVGVVRDGDPDENLESVTLLQERFIAIVPSRHVLAKQGRIKIEHLRNEPFVFYPQSAGKLAWERTMQVWASDAALPRPQVVQEAPHWVTIISLVGAGLGVSVAPACIKKITTGDVVSRRLVGSNDWTFLELVRRRGESSSIVHAFSNVAKKWFSHHARSMLSP